MGIWDRLGTIIKSYVTFEASEERTSRASDFKRHGDPDLDAAYEELDDFLKGNVKDKAGKAPDTTTGAGAKTDKKEKKKPVPEHLRADFAELGLEPEATVEECKEAYKKLLKIHHPDRHAKHEENQKKATAKTVRVNEAYERIRKYHQF